MNTYHIAGFPVTDELYHYGILGMRWGVRRFQNEDGSYTHAGKIRYGGLGSLFGFGKKTEKYTDAELAELERTGGKIDYSRVDHKENGDYWEAVAFAADLMTSRTGILSYADNIVRGAELVSGLFKSKQYEAEREPLSSDPVTGFKLKEKEYTPEEDLKRVNPDYRDFNTNSKNNCMLCTVAYEMRRRGYDVTAKKAGFGYYTEELSRWFPSVKINTYDPSSLPTYATAQNLANDLERQIKADSPEGSRGDLMVEWSFGGGHSMIYEIVNGKLVIRDGQSGETYDPASILAYCTFIQWARLDNIDFDPESIKECCK